MKKRFFSKIFVVAAMCLSFATKGFSQAEYYENQFLSALDIMVANAMEEKQINYESVCKLGFCQLFESDDENVRRDMNTFKYLSGDYLIKEINVLFNKISAWKDNPLVSSPIRAKVKQKLDEYKKCRFYFSAPEIKKREELYKEQQAELQRQQAEGLKRAYSSIVERYINLIMQNPAFRDSYINDLLQQRLVFGQGATDFQTLKDSIDAVIKSRKEVLQRQQDSIQAEYQRQRDSIQRQQIAEVYKRYVEDVIASIIMIRAQYKNKKKAYQEQAENQLIYTLLGLYGIGATDFQTLKDSIDAVIKSREGK